MEKHLCKAHVDLHSFYSQLCFHFCSPQSSFKHALVVAKHHQSCKGIYSLAREGGLIFVTKFSFSCCFPLTWAHFC